MPHKQAAQQLRLQDVDGFYTNKRQKWVHLVLIGEHAVTLCGRPVVTKIPLDGFRSIKWHQLCPTCLDAVPGFLDWWHREHQPVPY